MIFGHALGAPMNVLAAIGTYAAVCRAEGRPCPYPGGPAGPMDGVDARLLALAFEWATRSREARDEIFNVSNGDVFVWPNVWHAMVDALGVEPGEPSPARLAETMPEKAGVWERIVREHGLAAPSLGQLVGDSFIYADVLLATGNEAPPPSTLLSTIKVRQAGFGECMDTEDMLVDWLERLQALRILPPA